MIKKIICFDLEGPLSPQDHAYELMKWIPSGEKIFEVISRYDDLLTLEGREGYEPGDTLKLIIPFLIYHKICEKNLAETSAKARLVEGARELVEILKRENWKVYIISTSYQQHALSIARRLGIPRNRVFCTKFPLDKFLEKLFFAKKEFPWAKHVFEAKRFILEHQRKDEEIKRYLDEFFWRKLPETELWPVFNAVTVMGGERKTEALNKIATSNRMPLKQMVAVGDSITDFKMLRAVDKAGGLAIVFNGNEYALPYGTVGVNSYDLRSLLDVLDAWEKGGRRETKKRILEDPTHTYHWLKGIGKKEYQNILNLHKQARAIVRGSAAKLG